MQEELVCPDGTTVGRTGTACDFETCPYSTFSWGYKSIEPTTSGVPMTDVILSVASASNQKTYSLGTYEGSCSVITATSSWNLLPGEISGTICWFAGGGTELGIFRENMTFTVKKGLLDEGSEEASSTRGANMETIATLGK
jgi:hypothetical protein